MSIRKVLQALASAVADEAERNSDFRAQVELALGLDDSATEAVKRKGGRRTPAVLDPVELARRGEGSLREGLTSLDHEQLLDIVAQYGMDPSKLVMKWKDSARVIDRIIEIALARATKGDAFRGR
jgi:hypothetical protein